MSAPSLYRLISTYWDRYDLLVEAMKRTDDAEGDLAKKKANAAQFRAGDRLTEVVVEICAYMPTWKVDARLKRDFIASYIKSSGTYLEPAAMDALLKTVGKLTLPEDGAAS